MHAGKQPCVFREKSRIKTSHCIHLFSCSDDLFLKGASLFLVSCVTCLWTQDVGAMDMGLLEREMDCIAPYMCPICHRMSRLFHTKSPTVQGCHTNWCVCDTHGTSYAPDVPLKEAFTARKEAYSADVSDELICVTPLLVITCVAVCCSMLQYVTVCCSVCWFMWDVSFVWCGSQRVAVYCSVCCSVLLCCAVCVDSRETSSWYHVCCSVLQCVAVCCSVLERALQCVAVCCSVLTPASAWPDSFMCVPWLIHTWHMTKKTLEKKT